MDVTISIVAGVALIMFLVGWFIRKRVEQRKVDNAERLAESILTEAADQAETIKKTEEIEMQDELYRAKADFDRESNTFRQESQRTENRNVSKEQNLDRKGDYVAKREREIQKQEQLIRAQETALSEKNERLEQLVKQQDDQLEHLAGVTADEAKQMLLKNVESRICEEAAQQARNILEEARQNAEHEAREIISQAIQRFALDHVVESTVSVVALPDDEMKGRIIGREGRNIRAFEMATGIDVIVDDTPRAVVLSGFDPTRREIAKISLEKLKRK